MDHSPDRYAIGAAVAAIAVGFTLCANAGGRAEHASSVEVGADESESTLPALLASAQALAQSGHHEEAIPILQRALTITRAQYGLFDLRQQDVLKALAASLTAVERLPEAQDLMIYRVRTAEKAYGEGNPKVIPAACELGDWFAEVGMSLQARMAYYMALNIVGTTDSLDAPIIVEPLRGIARTRMRAQSYPVSMLRRSLGPMLGAPIGSAPRAGQRLVSLNREGEEALKRALRIVEADPEASPQTLIETLIQMGDWYQIKKLPREALPYYQRAWQHSRTAPSPSSSASTTLNVPVRVYYPTPQIVGNAPAVHAQENYVQVEFTVAADGSVQDARIVDRDASDRYAQDIFDAVRASSFRPKFVDGQPVAAPGITYREVFWTGG
ncbi:MAG TPA: energy transducer TonB [Steroidobacteraceae bacterium]|jgi:TonB family protein|nr:energy transducer TonB [Steroidobacteraceae bacterium]